MPNKIIITRGRKGWGGPLTLEKTETKKYVASITGGGIDPVAQRIADIIGAEARDGFKEKVEPEEMICVVIDCGGTARCGVYPKLGVLTINIKATPASGPLAQFIKEDNYVSDVSVASLEKDMGIVETGEEKKTVADMKNEAKAKVEETSEGKSKLVRVISKLGGAVGNVIGKFYQAGRDAIDVVIKNVLPFMAFISVIVGLINYTGVGTIIANTISPFAGNIFGLLIISLICSIPFLSPVLGPGAVIAQVIGTLLGTQIAAGAIPTAMALPALFAINAQVGADFIPVGLTLGEAEPYTVEIGVPAVLFSRLITGPAAVLIAWLLSFGL